MSGHLPGHRGAVPGMAQHGIASPVGAFGLGHQPVDECRERVEAHHALRVGDEVGERVDVVVDVPAGAVVDQVLDAADVDARGRPTRWCSTA